MSSFDSIHTMNKIFEEADCLYTYDEVQSAIVAIGKEINAALFDENPLILIVMNGGLIFGGQLLSQLNFPLELDYLHATRYGQNTQGKTLKWHVKPLNTLKDRSVLLVDDILDEGKTLLDIIDYCYEQGAKTVRTAVLTEKRHDRKADKAFKPDFSGLELEDRFVFGFGMDYQGYWRNAPGIYAVKGL